MVDEEILLPAIDAALQRGQSLSACVLEGLIGQLEHCNVLEFLLQLLLYGIRCLLIYSLCHS